MNRFLFATALALMCAALPANAGDDGVKTRLEAFVPKGDAMQVYLHINNTSGRNICFFLDTRFLSWREGLVGMDYAAVPDVPVDISDVHVAWSDRHDAIFPVSYKFLDNEHAARVRTLTYTLDAYDCVAMFSRSHGEAKPLFSRKVIWTLNQPVPEQP